MGNETKWSGQKQTFTYIVIQFLTKETKQSNEKGKLFPQMVLKQLKIHMENTMIWNSYIKPYTKNILRQITNLNVKTKIIKHLGENRKEYLPNLG